MKTVRFLLLLLSITVTCLAQRWPLDAIDDSLVIHGMTACAPGVAGQSLVLNGESLIELKDSAQLASGIFTLSVWFNPYQLAGSQQILVGKNRYSLGDRQWSLIIEPDGRLKAYFQQSVWSTISCVEPLKAGVWHLATMVVDASKATLFLNGKPVGEVKLKTPILSTKAPITLGGIWDEGQVRQAFTGAVDELWVQPRAVKAEEVASSYRPVASRHELPKFVAGLPLWNDVQSIPKAAELPQVQGAEFHVIKKRAPDDDQCRFTLGVGLAWHQGRLYASYGFNRGEENTPTEEAHVKVSDDGGKTWGPAQVMDVGEGDLAVSHGVFLSQGGRLWAFMGAYHAHAEKYHRVHTRAYLLDEATGRWEAQGIVIEDGFWPMQEPLRMEDGNWIMAGLHLSPFAKGANLPTVAISRGADFTKWESRVIPAAPGLGTNLWGESTVIVDGKRITNISRYGKRSRALLSESDDYGRSWTSTALSNLPMATSKPYAGTLSTGQRFLVCTTTADTGGKRTPLTIAVSKPGESLFSQVFLIRTSVFDHTPGVSAPNADFSYPYAVEYGDKLYIGYTHKSHMANELAVIPVSSLKCL
jgi:hypothetical protein